MPTPENPHRRFNPLIGEWVLVSPHRSRRPWLGQVEKSPPENLPVYDPTCYLCPGNSRVGGKVNPVYTGTYVFDNDFSSLLSPSELSVCDHDPDRQPGEKISYLYQAQIESGVCRVVCFSPRHDLTLPELSQQEVMEVTHTWIKQTAELSRLDFIKYVQVFENKGAMMGCSNPHPHSQIWATSQVPNEPAKEERALAEYNHRYGSCLLCTYFTSEAANGERVVARNENFIAIVPYWAVWPFEILLVSSRHLPDLPHLTQEEIADLADILRQITICYDNLFETSFPYSMGFHQAPVNIQNKGLWHLHAHFYPPLLRSATVRKFMVGFEMLAMPQRDLTAELAASRLRSLDKIHYRKRN